MLIRKPNIGEVLTWKLDKNIDKYIVNDIDDHFVYVSNTIDNKSEIFIWKHVNGDYNTLLYNEDK